MFAAIGLFENYFGVATTAHKSGRRGSVPKCVKKTWDSGTVGHLGQSGNDVKRVFVTVCVLCVF